MTIFSRSERYFQDLRDRICTAFEQEDRAHFVRTSWDREQGGSGVMALMHGSTFEKVGVNYSSVKGVFSEEFRASIPGAGDDGRFRACGVSLVAHPANPKCPAVHMNLRRIETSKGWFGGGTDLTPYFRFAEDETAFHGALQAACDRFDPDYYPEFKAWCDRYFFLPHRNEPRGVGGIFFDNFDRGGIEQDFALVQAVGEAFLQTYPPIVARRKDEPFTEQDREHQLIRRGRYVEFNLLYDRGTTFGLKTGGNSEAILMSMPPVVKWP
ncbi:MAG: oxygen-dependent coproporphyrinogen oxidase [Mariprofundales bacterium]